MVKCCGLRAESIDCAMVDGVDEGVTGMGDLLLSKGVWVIV